MLLLLLVQGLGTAECRLVAALVDCRGSAGLFAVVVAGIAVSGCAVAG